MSAITADGLKLFRDVFPAVATCDVSDAAISYWWDLAVIYISGGWSLSGKALEHARNLMTAHLLYTSGKSASGDSSTGAAQSASEGSVSVSFVAPTTKSGWGYWLSGSPYGVQLWAFLNLKSAGGSYVGGLPESSGVRKVGGVF